MIEEEKRIPSPHLGHRQRSTTPVKETETKRSLSDPTGACRLPLGGSGAGNSPPPGTVVDTQQNVAAQRGGSENAKESPHLKQRDAESA